MIRHRLRSPTLIPTMSMASVRLIALPLLVCTAISSCAMGDQDVPDVNASRSPDATKTAPTAGHATIVRIDPGGGDVLDVLPTGPGPLHLVTASGHIWIQNFGDGTLTRVDPTSATASTVRPGGVAGIASDGKDLWIAHDRNVLARIDGVTGKKQVAFRLSTRQLYETGNAGFVGVGGGSLWVTIPPRGREAEELWRVDPKNGEVLARIPIGTDANPPFAHGRYLWVITKEDQTLTRVDMGTNSAQRVEADAYPWLVTAGGGALWVAHHANPKIVRLQSEKGEVAKELPFETNPRGVATGDGRLWVATEDGVYAIDPATNTATRVATLGPFPPDTGPIGIAFIAGSLWVSIE